MELLDGLADSPEWLKILTLALATLISEDLTTISSGVMVSQGNLSFFTATLGCFLGIFFGDGLLYLVGLVIGKPALKSPLFRRFLSEERVETCATWFEKNGIAVVIISRFIPGTRLPTYFAAGLLGAKAKYFLLAAAIATAIWTPLLVAASFFFGQKIQAIFEINQRNSWLVFVLGIGLMFILLRFLMKFGDWKVRRRAKSRIKRIIHWEFWPLWIFYFPVFLYNLFLAIRHRRIGLPLLANPGIEYGGYIGESKSDIMSSFEGNETFFARHLRVPDGDEPKKRVRHILDWMKENGIEFPIILKPDIGQRGTGVQRVDDEAATEAYLAKAKIAVHAQEYAHGPYEFGVFYLRFPDQQHGTILGLTGKEFPAVAGDGVQTLEDLILRNPAGMGRYHLFLKRFKHRLDEVLPPGEILPLVRAGNHCLGTIFNDSNHLITDAMTQKFDEISNSIPEFYIGRYDVRADDLEKFRRGEAFKIVELNGASSEPGHIYDSRHGLLYAYRTLFKQYKYIWKLGEINATRGKHSSLSVFIRQYFKYRKIEKRHPASE